MLINSFSNASIFIQIQIYLCSSVNFYWNSNIVMHFSKFLFEFKNFMLLDKFLFEFKYFYI